MQPLPAPKPVVRQARASGRHEDCHNDLTNRNRFRVLRPPQPEPSDGNRANAPIRIVKTRIAIRHTKRKYDYRSGGIRNKENEERVLIPNEISGDDRSPNAAR